MIQWQESPTGFAAVRYAIVLEGSHRWQLRVKGRSHSEHRTASAAKAAAEQLEGTRRRNRHLLRTAGILGAVAGLLLLTAALRFETNPARAEAQALTGEMDAAFTAVQDGTADLADYSGATLAGAPLTLPTGLQLSVLIGEAGGECYVSYWQAAGFRRARVLADNYPCEPGQHIASPNEYSYKRRAPLESWHFPLAQGDFDWRGVLPTETRQRGWFLPAVLLLSVVGLSVVTRAAATFLSRGFGHLRR